MVMMNVIAVKSPFEKALIFIMSALAMKLMRVSIIVNRALLERLRDGKKKIMPVPILWLCKTYNNKPASPLAFPATIICG